MQKRLPIFYSTLLLTGVNLLLRLGSTGFHVFLSRKIGPEGIGLLQLVLSTGSLAMVFGLAGIRTASMYLTAQALGKGRGRALSAILSGCFLYGMFFSLMSAGLLYVLAPWISRVWIGNPQVVFPLRMYGAMIPSVCLCGVLSGYYTAQGRIVFLSCADIGEQLITIAVTVFLLLHCTDAVQAALRVIGGNLCGNLFTLLLLSASAEVPKGGREKAMATLPGICRYALPIAAGDSLRTGISTTEHLMVPKRLSLCPGIKSPLAGFGIVTGMVFPVIMFPACILFGLCEILIPEMSRLKGSGDGERIRALTTRALWAAGLYGGLIFGIGSLGASQLCQMLYKNKDALPDLKRYSLLIPMLYCDIVTDAITKGLGQHRVCVGYNIFTNLLDVLGLYFLLPKAGMDGYYGSFVISHAINFLLSIRHLLRITKVKVNWKKSILASGVCLMSIWAAWRVPWIPGRILAYVSLCLSGWCLAGLISEKDFQWFLQKMPHPLDKYDMLKRNVHFR